MLSRADRTTRDGLAEGLEGFKDTDTAAQSPTLMERDKDSPFLCKYSAEWDISDRFLKGNGLGDGSTRQFEK